MEHSANPQFAMAPIQTQSTVGLVKLLTLC